MHDDRKRKVFCLNNLLTILQALQKHDTTFLLYLFISCYILYGFDFV